MAYRMMSHVAIVGRMMNTFVHGREQRIVITNLIPRVVKKSVYTAHAQVCGLVERGVSRFLLTKDTNPCMCEGFPPILIGNDRMCGAPPL